MQGYRRGSVGGPEVVRQCMSTQETSRIAQDFVPFHRLSSKPNPVLCFTFVIVNLESQLARVRAGAARGEVSVYLRAARRRVD